jgi:hypothetical protein
LKGQNGLEEFTIFPPHPFKSGIWSAKTRAFVFMFAGILQTLIGFILRGLTKASGQINICSPFCVEGASDQIPASSDADTSIKKWQLP